MEHSTSAKRPKRPQRSRTERASRSVRRLVDLAIAGDGRVPTDRRVWVVLVVRVGRDGVHVGDPKPAKSTKVLDGRDVRESQSAALSGPASVCTASEVNRIGEADLRLFYSGAGPQDASWPHAGTEVGGGGPASFVATFRPAGLDYEWFTVTRRQGGRWD